MSCINASVHRIVLALRLRRRLHRKYLFIYLQTTYVFLNAAFDKIFCGSKFCVMMSKFCVTMHIDPLNHTQLKVRTFNNQDGGRPSFSKNSLNCHNSATMFLHEIWYEWCNLTLSDLSVVKSSICLNRRWRTASVLKLRKSSPYLGNGSTDLHEIWHSDAQWPSQPHCIEQDAVCRTHLSLYNFNFNDLRFTCAQKLTYS